MDELIREDDRAVYGNKGYVNDGKKRAAEAAGVLGAVKGKAKPGAKFSPASCERPKLDSICSEWDVSGGARSRIFNRLESPRDDSRRIFCS